MAGMLALSDQDFNVTMINMLRLVIVKVDNIQEQIDIISREKYYERIKMKC